jgi:hypothetical protein
VIEISIALHIVNKGGAGGLPPKKKKLFYNAHLSPSRGGLGGLPPEKKIKRTTS